MADEDITNSINLKSTHVNSNTLTMTAGKKVTISRRAPTSKEVHDLGRGWSYTERACQGPARDMDQCRRQQSSPRSLTVGSGKALTAAASSLVIITALDLDSLAALIPLATPTALF